MKTLLASVAIVLAAVVASAIAKATIQEKHPIDWYDCSGKPDKNYLHPNDCTRFISCSGGIASERDCAECNVPGRCRDGRTVYNVTLDACLWADETRCEVGGDDGVTEVTTGPTNGPTTEPTPDITTVETTQQPTTEQPTTEQPTTEQPTTEQPTTTTKPPTNPGRPKPGDPCDPTKCKNSGWCQTYWRCDNKTSTIVEEECGQDLSWNPLNPDGTTHIHGGNCDKYDNLRNETKHEYNSDEKCFACFWRETGDCQADYEYQAPDLINRNVQILSCSPGLVFVKAKETCQRCQDAKDSNGNACCAGEGSP